MVTIKGIKLSSLSITNEDKEDKVTGNYELISSLDKVLAKQSFNGYSDIKVTWSSDTIKSLNSLMQNIKNDLNNVLGFNEKEN